MKNKKRFSVLGLGIVCAFAMMATSILYLGAFTGGQAIIQLQATQQRNLQGGQDRGGLGTVESPFLVGSQDTLNTLVRSNANLADRHFRLINDIDFTSSWNPITTLAAGNVFDGNGFTINNFTGTVTNFGLFSNLFGTVRDVNFTNVSLTGGHGTIGVVTARLQTGALIENVRVESGVINGGSQVGGLVGRTVAGTNAIIRNVYNGATITGVGNVGGIVGRAGDSDVQLLVENAQNSGNINATGSFNGGIVGYVRGAGTNVNILRSKNSGNLVFGSWSGGIVGEVSTTSTLVVDWTINTGTITGAAGIVGSAWNGHVTIRNSINDAVITGSQDALARRSSAAVVIENSWFNNTKMPSGRLINNQTNTTITDSGSQTTLQMSQAAFLEMVHANGGEQNVFVFENGELTLRVLVVDQTLVYRFEPGDGVGENFIIRQSVDLLTITLPSHTTTGFIVPTKVGYIFDEWRVEVGSDVFYLQPGTTFTNTGEVNNLVFTATFREAQFTLDIAGYGIPSIVGGHTYAEIGDTVNLTTENWTDGNFQWNVRMGATAGYTNIGITQNESFTIDEQFILDHVYFYETPVGDRVGRIEIRVINVNTSTAINTLSPVNGGTFEFQVDNGQPIQVSLGNRISIQRVDAQPNQITRITATPSDHFELENIILRDGGTELHRFEGAETFDTSGLSNFLLGNMQNFTIEVNFAPIPYDFHIFAAVVGEYEDPISNVITINNETDIRMGHDASIDVTANSTAGSYRFVAWKILLSNGTFDRQPAGALNFARTFNNVDSLTLGRYLQQDGTIVVIAEFAPTHLLSVNVGAGQSDFGNISVTVIDPIEGTSELGNFSNLSVSHGSTVIIYARPNPNGIFDLLHMTGLPVGHLPVEGRVEFTVTAGHDIDVVFTYRQFNIVFQARENQVNPVSGVSGFVPNVDGIESLSTLRLGSTINPVAGTGSSREGFRFSHFTINGLDGNPMMLEGVQDISLSLLLANLQFINQERSFVITANYVRTFTLDVRYAAGTENMGEFSVYIVNGTDEEYTTYREFDAGTRLVIRTTPFNFHTVESIGGTTTGLRGDGSAEITNLRESRTVTIRFVADVFDVKPTFSLGNDNAVTMASRTEGLTVGNTVELSVTPPGGRQITSWTLNGRNIDTIDGVVRRGNTIEIELTITMLEWLEANEFELRSVVDFGMTTAVLMAIILPSVLIPLLIAAAVLYFLRSRKKYASVKAELVAANRQKATFNQASMIQDLKDGKNVGQVTDADVKKAMKDKKKDK
ncbi:MAG: hypothetical protein FWE45_05145 [Firmicutes bacterium]|nr:hypothetical protein [Bacillota bacterium]